MLNYDELVKDLKNDTQKEMLRGVNLPDFTKCVSAFSGIKISELKKEVIKDYLLTWARNKEYIFKMLGNKIKVDKEVDLKFDEEIIATRIVDLQKRFPSYGAWLHLIKDVKSNKLMDLSYNYRFRDFSEVVKTCCNIEPSTLSGSTITAFFARQLKASNEFVTELGKVYEDLKIKGNYTMSIDPVDIILASENPYNWTSCYRLELNNEESHADGAMAAVLDTGTMIGYFWSTEGEFNLNSDGNVLKFKKIRYKRLRNFFCVNESLTKILFCDIYPKRPAVDSPMFVEIRDIVEKQIAEYHNVENLWGRFLSKGVVQRCSDYGYDEFYNRPVYILKPLEKNDEEIEKDIMIYDFPIKCPCGCGEDLIGSSHADFEYTGGGFRCENFHLEDAWCDYSDDRCSEAEDCCEANCSDCTHWRDAHPVCDLDTYEECEYHEEYCGIDVSDGVARPCSESCADSGCPVWERHNGEEEEEEEGED